MRDKEEVEYMLRELRKEHQEVKKRIKECLKPRGVPFLVSARSTIEFQIDLLLWVLKRKNNTYE